jgi:hypothetical protein
MRPAACVGGRDSTEWCSIYAYGISILCDGDEEEQGLVMQGALYVSDCGGSGSWGSIMYMGVGLVSAKHKRTNVVEEEESWVCWRGRSGCGTGGGEG